MSHQIDVKALMAAALAAAEARKNRPTENFWPNVKNWLQTQSGPQPLPTCPVCYCELDVKGIDPVPPMALDDSDDNDNDTECETGGMAAILPCGHMTCHNCTEQSLHTSADNHLAGRTDDEGYPVDEISSCPICRAVPRALDEDCGHHVHYHVPTRAMEVNGWIDQVPLTTSEGGSLPELCLACEKLEEHNPSTVADEDDFDDAASYASNDTATTWDNSSHDGDEHDKDELASLHHNDSPGWSDIILEYHQHSPETLERLQGDDNNQPVEVQQHCCYYSHLLKVKDGLLKTQRITAELQFIAQALPPPPSLASLMQPGPRPPTEPDEARAELLQYLDQGAIQRYLGILDQGAIQRYLGILDHFPVTDDDPDFLYLCDGRDHAAMWFTEEVNHAFPTMISWVYKRSAR